MDADTIPSTITEGSGVKQQADGTYICCCCGATSQALSGMKHDETCAYNNTSEALSEFVSDAFLLGGENSESTAQGAYCVAGLGPITCQDIKSAVYRLADTDRDTRADAFMDLALVFPQDFELLHYFVDNPIESDALCLSVRNYLCYELVSRRDLVFAADELNRALAKHDTMGELFKETFSTVYSIPSRVLK